MIDIVTTFLVTGYENCLPVNPQMREVGDVVEPEREFNLDEKERQTLRDSLLRTLSRWNPTFMIKKLAAMLCSSEVMREALKKSVPGILPMEKELEFGTRLWIHRVKDDVDRMTLKQRFIDASSHLYKRVCPSICMSVNLTSKIPLIHLQLLTNPP